jgi:hypothetical protein
MHTSHQTTDQSDSCTTQLMSCTALTQSSHLCGRPSNIATPSRAPGTSTAPVLILCTSVTHKPHRRYNLLLCRDIALCATPVTPSLLQYVYAPISPIFTTSRRRSVHRPDHDVFNTHLSSLITTSDPSSLVVARRTV